MQGTFFQLFVSSPPCRLVTREPQRSSAYELQVSCHCKHLLIWRHVVAHATSTVGHFESNEPRRRIMSVTSRGPEPCHVRDNQIRSPEPVQDSKSTLLHFSIQSERTPRDGSRFFVVHKPIRRGFPPEVLLDYVDYRLLGTAQAYTYMSYNLTGMQLAHCASSANRFCSNDCVKQWDRLGLRRSPIRRRTVPTRRPVPRQARS